MIVSFRTVELRDLCGSLARAEAVVGPLHSRELIALIADIEALDHAADLMEIRRTDVTQLHGEELAVSVGASYVAMFTPVGKTIHRAGEGLVAWKKVRRVQLKDIRKRE